MRSHGCSAARRKMRAADLGELVYNDPTDSPRLVAAAEYLSGNVRVKLEHARAAAANDTSLEVNVTALERVLPADIGADEIAPRLGAAWITAEDHQAFLAEILDDRSVQVEHPGADVWAVRARRDTLLASSEWGTSRMSAGQIAKAVLEQRPITVTDELDDGRARRQRRRDRRRPGESQRDCRSASRSGAGRIPTAPAGCWANITAGSTASCCGTTAPRASGSRSPAWRAAFNPAPTSAPPSRGSSPSPPSGSFTRSAPARPPR